MKRSSAATAAEASNESYNERLPASVHLLDRNSLPEAFSDRPAPTDKHSQTSHYTNKCWITGGIEGDGAAVIYSVP